MSRQLPRPEVQKMDFIRFNRNLRIRVVEFPINIIGLLLLSISLSLMSTPAGAFTQLVTVTFYQNSYSGDPISAFTVGNTTQNLPLVQNLPIIFSKSGSTFAGWNSLPNGLGTSYADGSSYSYLSDIALYAQWRAIPIIHTVTFYENASGSDLTSTYQLGTTAGFLNLVGSLTPSFVKDGSNFLAWNSSPNGTGTIFSDGAAYSFGSDLALYAQWVALPTGTTSFGVNGGTGSVSSLSSAIGSSVVLPSGSGVVRNGYTFAGWNTSADGTGTTYASGATYVLSSSTTLYALWSPDVYTLTFAPNGGVVAPTLTNYTFGSTPLLLPMPTYAGYAFNGWFSAATGGSLLGLANSTFTPTSTTTLYAQWALSGLTVTYSPGGGTVSQSSVSYAVGTAPLILPTPTYAGYTFNGWFSASTGGTLIGAAGVFYTPTVTTILYAQWTQVAQLTLTFDANGGSGSIAPIVGSVGSIVHLPGPTGYVRAGFSLASWSTTRSGAGVSYLPNAAFTLLGTSTLYARWTGHVPAVLYGAIGNFTANTTKLTTGLKKQVDRLVVAIRAHKYVNVALYGYTASTGLASLNRSVSQSRASSVASYLRGRLNALHVKKVVITASGQGAIPGRTSVSYSRVEVFVR